jgi:hypothetical protein
MSMEKSQIKMGTARDICAQLDAMLGVIQKDLLRNKGSLNSYSAVAKEVRDLLGEVDQDVEGGKFKGAGDPASVANEVKRYVNRCLEILDKLSKQSHANIIKIEGKVEAFRHAMDVTKKIHDQEAVKIRTIEQGIRDGRVEFEQGPAGSVTPIYKGPVGGRRPVGARPVNKIAELKAASQTSKAPEKAKKTPTKRGVSKPRGKGKTVSRAKPKPRKRAKRTPTKSTKASE